MGLEGTGKLRGCPPAPPHGQAVPAAPPPAFPSLSGSPSSHFSNKSQRLCGLGTPSTNPTDTDPGGGRPCSHWRSRRPVWRVPPPWMASTSSTEASRGAHELMPPGEILSLEGAGTQGTHRWVSLCSLPSSMELGGGVYPGSQKGLGEMSPGRPPAVTSR